LLEIGFGNLDLWAVESFGKVMEILTGQGVQTLKHINIPFHAKFIRQRALSST
jgi:hypothetical protein